MDQSATVSGMDSANIDQHAPATRELVQGRNSNGSAICSTQSMEQTYDTVFLNAKAGMDGVDKKKVQKVVYDMSKGSKYFGNEQRKEANERQKIENMMSRAASITQFQLSEHQKATDSKLVRLEASRDLSKIWVHVDMDAFYAAVETLVDPSLAGKPMAVGGISMICTANYEARKFGCRAAMPGFIARKLCPDLIFVKPDFKKYSYFSGLSRQVFHEYDPNFIAGSLDEAYLDITEVCRLRNLTSAEVAEDMRTKVFASTGLTCSAGVGPNRLLAKVCSDINKPNGQYVLGSDRSCVMEFISSLPIRKVSGIGKVTERMLKEVLGINICADLLTKRAHISALFSQISTDFFLAVGLGLGETEPPQNENRKSLGHERTFSALSDEKQLYRKLEELAELLVLDMAKEDLHGRTLTLKLKTTGFEVRTRAVSLPRFTNSKTEIMEFASKLLKAELPLSLRLMGLRINHFKLKHPELAEHSQKTITSFITKITPSSSSIKDEIDCTEGGTDEFQERVEDYFESAPELGSRSAEVERQLSRLEATEYSTWNSCSGKEKVEDYPERAPELDSRSAAVERQLLRLVATEYSTRNSCSGKAEQSNPESESGDEKGLGALTKRPGPSPTRSAMRGQQTLRSFILPHAQGNTVTSALYEQGEAGERLESVKTEIDCSRSERPSILEKLQGTGTSEWELKMSPVHESGSTEQLSIRSTRNSPRILDFGDAQNSNLATDRFNAEMGSLTSNSGILACQNENTMPLAPGTDQGAGEQNNHLKISLAESVAEDRDGLSEEVGHESCVQRWNADDQCVLCGLELNPCFPSARQEHQDYHFALSLQQQTPTRFTTSVRTPTRVVDKQSRKKTSQGGPSKRSPDTPLEYFFGRPKRSAHGHDGIG